MQLNMLKCKIHRATVTVCDLEYEGSISIDTDIIEAAGLQTFERVEIYNVNNGERFATYVIEGKKGAGEIGLNGAAARKAVKGDELIICAYCQIPSEEAGNYNATLVFVDKSNKISSIN